MALFRSVKALLPPNEFGGCHRDTAGTPRCWRATFVRKLSFVNFCSCIPNLTGVGSIRFLNRTVQFFDTAGWNSSPHMSDLIRAAANSATVLFGWVFRSRFRFKLSKIRIGFAPNEIG